MNSQTRAAIRARHAEHEPYDPVTPYEIEMREHFDAVHAGDPIALLRRAEDLTTHHLARLHAKWLAEMPLNATARTIGTIAGRQADERDRLRTSPLLDGRTAHVRWLYDNPPLDPSHGERARRRRLQWIAAVCDSLAEHQDVVSETPA